MVNGIDYAHTIDLGTCVKLRNPPLLLIFTMHLPSLSDIPPK